jgi:molybdopterin molybdotransferase
MTSVAASAIAVTPERCSLEDYLDGLLSALTPLGSESVGLIDALGRVVSVSVSALASVPPFDNSAMDGYAVRDEDVAGSSPEHPVRLTIVAWSAAGSPSSVTVREGEAALIMTGARLPLGTDRVIPVESSRTGSFDESRVVFLWESGKHHVRRAAEDITAGTILLEEGHVLSARDIGLLAATGHDRVLVRRRPLVSIVSTGDELRTELLGADGCVPDVNGLYLTAAVRSVGAQVARTLVAPDDRLALEVVLDRAAEGVDLIVSSGGLGAGTHDLVRTAMLTGSSSGSRPRWVSVAMKPGRPQAHGTWRGVPWIALPGNPTAALVSFESFVRPALDRLAGKKTDQTLANYLVSTGLATSAGTKRFIPLNYADGVEGRSVAPLDSGQHTSHSVAAMFSAPLIGVIAADVENVRPGDMLTALRPV